MNTAHMLASKLKTQTQIFFNINFIKICAYPEMLRQKTWSFII